MDQTNPLAELTNKRRLSALGPGGLTRDRAGFEVRDVHYTHYGRMCPIETPEGPNIGLISSLSTYAKVNEFGFLETPYFRVQDGVVDRKKPEFLAADVEDRSHIAPANTPFDKTRGRADGRRRSPCGSAASTRSSTRRDVDYMDVSPIQLVSPAAALIPFLEHDDANRALMGSNMQRQAVPLLVTEAPLVGTGLEDKVAEDSGALVLARRSGVVEFVSGEMIAVRYERDPDDVPIDYSEQPNLDIYRLTKFRRSNQDTCLNQRPVVDRGAEGQEGPGHRRRPGHPRGRAGARTQRAVRVHAVGRLQLRGRHPGEREAHQGRRLHLDPHRGVRAPGARHQARRRGDHARDPERLRGGGQEPRRGGRHPHRRPRPPGRHPGRQGDAQGRAGAVARGAPAQGDLRRQGRRRARRVAQGAARAWTASSSTSRCSRAARRTRAPSSRRRRRSRSCAARARRSASASPTCGWRASPRSSTEQLVNVLRSASTGEPIARKGRKFTARLPRRRSISTTSRGARR